jgi:2-desacetyl-2-hydroxyethyl bacteriochlorophyllide A dehydrogenase
MKAVVLEQPRQFAIHQIAPPGGMQTDEALVRVHRVGICGTDISGYLGKFPFYSYPRIPGHELGVEVVEVGEEVVSVKPGDRCAVEPYINNPESFASRRGRPNCCNDLRVLGVHTDGGMRPYFVVPARKLHVSTQLEFEQLALVETLGIGCHAVDRAAPQAGEFLLVIGAGPIGLSVIEFAKLARVRLVVMDMNPDRLEFCRSAMGVTHTLQFTGDGRETERLREICEGHLPTVVIDATGNRHSMQSAFEYAEHTGKVVYVGIVTDDICFRHPLLHARELTLLASRNSLPTDFRRIIQLIEQRQLDTRLWITQRWGFEQLVADFDQLTRPDSRTIKAIVEIPDA